VILGNPPYNAFAGTSPEEEGGLVEPYKAGLTTSVEDGGWGIKKFNLDDLYVRFFRIAERRIVKSGKGVVSYISNFSYLGDPSFVVMRQRFLEEFDSLWFDCMNGDSRETGKLTPDGKPDPSVFSTEQSRVGIRVGTAICLLVRKESREKTPTVRFQHYWGVTKRQDVLASLRLKNLDRKYDRASPTKANRYSFRPSNVAESYLDWPRITELCCSRSDGLFEKRAGALIDIDRPILEQRMKDYFDGSIGWDRLRALGRGYTRDAARFDAKRTRIKVLAQERYSPGRIRRYAVRPFDVRWCYYCPIRPLWNEPRPALWTNAWPGNAFIVSRLKTGKTPRGSPLFYGTALVDGQIISVNPSAIPVAVRAEPHGHKADPGMDDMFADQQGEPIITANLSEAGRQYLADVGTHDPDKDAETAGLIWMHALAIGYSPAYLTENADGIRQDWPRIPMPTKKDALLASAELGRRVAALLDTEKPVEGATCGTIRPELTGIGVISKVGGGELDPVQGHLDLTAGWGHAGKGGACMPGTGKYVERKTKDERQERLFGPDTLDVYLNDAAYWANVPRAVWDYYIGGYQVVKKWLSYREKKVLGRGLKLEEAEYVTEMVRRIAAIILLQPALDANYQTVKSETWLWPS